MLSRTVVARADEPVPDETAHPGVGGLVQAHRLLVPHHPNSSSLKWEKSFISIVDPDPDFKNVTAASNLDFIFRHKALVETLRSHFLA